MNFYWLCEKLSKHTPRAKKKEGREWNSEKGSGREGRGEGGGSGERKVEERRLKGEVEGRNGPMPRGQKGIQKKRKRGRAGHIPEKMHFRCPLRIILRT